jgi:DNA-binding Lrp family transcriptional regulator
LDELDVKIFRALISESAIAPSRIQVESSLREIARKLGSDDMTVRNRYKKLQDAGCMSAWRSYINPQLFGYSAVDVLVEVEPESAKADMMRKLRLVHGVVRIVDYYGKGMQILLFYDSEESRSRSVELISRITNAEKATQLKTGLPKSETKRLTESDYAIVGSLAMDARKPYINVAKELGFSSRTVKNRIEKLRREMTLFAVPELNMGDIPGLIPAAVSYSYMSSGAKSSVDKAMVSHFDERYLWGSFSDSEHAYIVLAASSMAEAERSLDWVRGQPGIAGARLLISVACPSFPENVQELFSRRRIEQSTLQENKGTNGAHSRLTAHGPGATRPV